MENNFNNQESYYRAKKRVEDLKGFYGNLVSYVLIISFLAFINLRYSPDHIWFFWPMLGWGIGVFFHAMKVFNFFPFFGKEWEEKKIKEYIEQEKNNTNKWQ